MSNAYLYSTTNGKGNSSDVAMHVWTSCVRSLWCQVEPMSIIQRRCWIFYVRYLGSFSLSSSFRLRSTTIQSKQVIVSPFLWKPTIQHQHQDQHTMKFTSAVLLSALAGSQAFVLPHSPRQSRGNRRLATLSTVPLFSTAAPQQETYEFTVSNEQRAASN